MNTWVWHCPREKIDWNYDFYSCWYRPRDLLHLLRARGERYCLSPKRLFFAKLERAENRHYRFCSTLASFDRVASGGLLPSPLEFISMNHELVRITARKNTKNRFSCVFVGLLDRKSTRLNSSHMS